ncbi:hypothetical protein PMAYCL1PPCAC_21419 [Pristionchus mayeri]|uniref:F-box domain-containing protein n=1 Tax=Pristionchus mayeri TaxID=1317129 RepID=A0AAN5I4H9_9BILA|nr:hypothetical protein PMAYCL1PPCAC_21419 [Pristionchus mayeri]
MPLLEQLPKELLWEIIGRAPAAVFKLRLVSRVLHNAVDEYVIQHSSITCVNEIVLRSHESGYSSRVCIVISNFSMLAMKLRDEHSFA